MTIWTQRAHPILFKSPRILMLDNIWKAHDSSPWKNNFINRIQIHNQSLWFKPMAILSMEFKSIIKAHDLNPWQFIYPKPNSHWQHKSPIFIGNIKAQFSLATSKPSSHWQYSKLNSHWQYQNPILIGNIKSPTYVGTIKKPKLITWHYFIESPRLSMLGKILHRNYFT